MSGVEIFVPMAIRSNGHNSRVFLVQHNPFKLPLSKHGIFLKRKRPLFLSERVLLESDFAKDGTSSSNVAQHVDPFALSRHRESSIHLKHPPERSRRVVRMVVQEIQVSRLVD